MNSDPNPIIKYTTEPDHPRLVESVAHVHVTKREAVVFWRKLSVILIGRFWLRVQWLEQRKVARERLLFNLPVANNNNANSKNAPGIVGFACPVFGFSSHSSGQICDAPWFVLLCLPNE